MATVFTQVGSFVGTKTKETRGLAASQAATAKAEAMAELRDGVATAGNTLKKLYALIAGNRTTHTVADNAAKDLLSDLLVGDHVFVTDDGDTRWALYLVTDVSPNEFVKVADPDTMGDQMSAAQIKTLYESNLDTNEFSDAEKAFLGALQTGLSSPAPRRKAATWLRSMKSTAWPIRRCLMLAILGTTSAACRRAWAMPRARSMTWVRSAISRRLSTWRWPDGRHRFL